MADASPEGGLHSSTIVIQPGGAGTVKGGTTSSTASAFSSSMASSSSQSSKTSKSGASTMTTSTKTTKSSKTTKSVTTKSTSSRNICIKSSTSSFKDSFGKNLGLDIESEMQKLMSSMDMQSARDKFFNFQPMALTTDSAAPKGGDLIKLDASTISQYMDEGNKDRLKFNFDCQQFESQTVTVKTDGNKVEVHAVKKAKIGDQETSEEYSRTYEMPTSGSLNPESVSSQFFNDGVLTIEIPVKDAMGEA